MSSVLATVDQRTKLAGHNRLELLLFRLGTAQRYGINVFKVQEVIQCPKLTRVPHANPVVRGIANMRGKTIPVMDLSMAVGMDPVDDLDNSYVIITEYNRSIQGFLVSSVDRIINMKWEDILPPPAGAGLGSYLTAVSNVDNQLVEIIDVEKVLSEVIGVVDEISQATLDNAQAREQVRRHVLVVDDSSVARNQIKRCLEKIGYEITLANDGRRGLEQLIKWAEEGDINETLSLVISDVEMPEMDGYTLTTEIRKDPRLAGLHVILHTSLSGVFNNAMVEKVGANKFIAKFQADYLAQAVLDATAQIEQTRSAAA
jgi:two-component system, chemotaxis family, chemotaxis protein CheV